MIKNPPSNFANLTDICQTNQKIQPNTNKCNLVSSMEKKCNCVKICQIHSYNMQFKYFIAIISYSINSKGNANSKVNIVVWESRSDGALLTPWS